MKRNHSIVNGAKNFLISYLRDKKNNYEKVHPWRKDWKFVIHHCYRVEDYAVQIIEEEGFNLSKDDILHIQIAAILHDVGTLDSRENHAQKGAEIITEWFKTNPDIASQINDISKIIHMIETHSDKQSIDDDICCDILKDADILDEIGVISIFMTSNWIDKKSPYFFNELLERVQGFELDYCDEKMKLLKTLSAKKILEKKRNFIELFINQLEFELKGTENIKL